MAGWGRAAVGLRIQAGGHVFMAKKRQIQKRAPTSWPIILKPILLILTGCYGDFWRAKTDEDEHHVYAIAI